jgi:hypothetical protein
MLGRGELAIYLLIYLSIDLLIHAARCAATWNLERVRVNFHRMSP